MVYTYEELIAVTDEKMMNVIYTADQQRVEESIGEQIQEKNEYEIVYRVVGKNDRLIWVNDIGRKIITNDGREANDQYYDGHYRTVKERGNIKV